MNRNFIRTIYLLSLFQFLRINIFKIIKIVSCLLILKNNVAIDLVKLMGICSKINLLILIFRIKHRKKKVFNKKSFFQN